MNNNNLTERLNVEEEMNNVEERTNLTLSQTQIMMIGLIIEDYIKDVKFQKMKFTMRKSKSRLVPPILLFILFTGLLILFALTYKNNAADIIFILLAIAGIIACIVWTIRIVYELTDNFTMDKYLGQDIYVKSRGTYLTISNALDTLNVSAN